MAVLRDCVRARARSGAPPLRTLVFEKAPGNSPHAEEQMHAFADIESLMRVESPSTSVLHVGRQAIDRLLLV